MPCTQSSSSSACAEWPARFPCMAATCGQSTTSPSRPGSGPASSPPALAPCAPPVDGGRSSSIGNDSTSVGPGSSIHFTCKSVMAVSSTSSTESSASGWIRNRSSTNRATEASATSSTDTPDSLAISMVTWHPRPCSSAAAAAWRRARGSGAPGAPGGLGLLPRRGVRVVPLVRVDDLPDQLVPHHVVAGQLGEVNVRDAVEDVLHHAQPAHLPRQQVDLRDVAGDHHLGAEAEPGQEHLHLLRRRVLRLIKDDERVIEAPAPHECQRRYLDRAGGGELGDRLRVHHVVQRV